MSCQNITTNTRGIPYLSSTAINVNTAAVEIAMGWRQLPPCGLFALRLTSAIPTGTTGTLPINLTLNGITRPLTTFGGESVTAENLTGTGVLLIFNDRTNGILQVVQSL